MSLLKRTRDFFSELENRLDRRFALFAGGLVLLNLLLSVATIIKVPYTEIDWVAYMEEVSGVLNDGQLDYVALRGGTGPLVYPAGFVYLFSALYYLTDHGTDVRKAQYCFAVFQSVLLVLVLFVYRKCYNDRADRPDFPIWVAGFLVLSRRVMSLFVLRLFNDGIQMVFMYAAIASFTLNQWGLGCFLFSLSVSIKMNALLFAPGIAVLLCQARGTGGAIRRIFLICLPIQLALGAPFLWHAPWSYVSRAFELTRQFLYKWSVNGAVLSEHLFLDKKLSLLLLILHLVTLLVFGQVKWTAQAEGGLLGLLHVTKEGKNKQGWLRQVLTEKRTRQLNAGHVSFVLLTCNFVGIVFSRTLHYQFYLWYAHSLPLLIWKTSLFWIAKIALLLVIEIVFNVYPPHRLAALSLHVAHFVLLFMLWLKPSASSQSIYKDLKKKVEKQN